jgi:hypothetical protein
MNPLINERHRNSIANKYEIKWHFMLGELKSRKELKFKKIQF